MQKRSGIVEQDNQGTTNNPNETGNSTYFFFLIENECRPGAMSE
jgi:hypothetical protein